MQAWKKKVERWENKPAKKAKDAKNRELFEKVFPELKKQREDKERMTRFFKSTLVIEQFAQNSLIIFWGNRHQFPITGDEYSTNYVYL